MREQRLSKGLVTQEIEKLLSLQKVRRDPGKRLSDFRREVAPKHAPEIGLGEVAQSVLRGMLDELVEIDRVVHCLQMLMINVAVRHLAHALRLFEQHGSPGRRRCMQ